MTHKNVNKLFDTEHLKKDLKSRSVRGGAITLTSQSFKFVLNLVSNIWLARLLTPDDYGLVGMVTAVTGFLTLFNTLGLSMVTIQKDDITHDQVSTLFWINSGFSIIMMLIIMVSSTLLAWVYDEPRLVSITIVLACVTAINGFGMQHAALLRRQMRYSQLAINEISSLILGLGAALIAAQNGLGYWSLVIYPLIKSVVSTLHFWLASRWIPGRPVWRTDDLGQMLKFGGNLTGFTFVNYGSRNLDNILIGKVWGATQLGLYAKAYQLLLLPIQQINGPITSVSVPLLSRLASSPQRLRKTYLRILEKIFLITTPLVIFMIYTSDWLIYLLLGEQWVQASDIFKWLGLVGLLQPLNNSTGWLFIAQGKTDKMFQWGCFATIITVASFVVGLQWGATGVAASYSLTTIFIKTPILIWYVSRNSSVTMKDFYVTLAPIMIATLVSSLILFILRYVDFIQQPLIGCSFFITQTIIFFFVVIFILPGGRSIIFDCKQLFLEFKK